MKTTKPFQWLVLQLHRLNDNASTIHFTLYFHYFDVKFGSKKGHYIEFSVLKSEHLLIRNLGWVLG